MFAELTLTELKDLVRVLKFYHDIAGFSRMKKAELVDKLSARFVLLNGAIYLKNEDQKRAKAQEAQDAKNKEQAEAPAVKKASKPRAKKTKPEPEAEPEVERKRITNAQLQARIMKFFKGLSDKELDSTMEQKIKLFKKRESTALTKKQKQLFNDLFVSFF